MSLSQLDEVRLLGTRVHVLTTSTFLQFIAAAVATGRRLAVGHHNLHSLALVQDDVELRSYYEGADLVYADGMSVISLARLHGAPMSRTHRLTSLDFVDSLLTQAAALGWRVYYLGSAPNVIDRGIDAFRRIAPGLNLRYRHGYFDLTSSSSESSDVCAEINRFDPDLLIVGMGMPRQEHFLLRNRDVLRARVLLPIGALADYHAGAVPTPPRWAGKLGLEWLFRLAAEPRRLGYRYLVEPWRLLIPTIRSVGSARRRR